MSFEDEWADLNNIYQNMKAENEDLRALVREYYTMHYGDLLALAQDIRRGGEPIEHFVEEWQRQRDALQERAKDLLGEERKP